MRPTRSRQQTSMNSSMRGRCRPCHRGHAKSARPWMIFPIGIAWVGKTEFAPCRAVVTIRVQKQHEL